MRGSGFRNGFLDVTTLCSAGSYVVHEEDVDTFDKIEGVTEAYMLSSEDSERTFGVLKLDTSERSCGPLGLRGGSGGASSLSGMRFPSLYDLAGTRELGIVDCNVVSTEVLARIGLRCGAVDVIRGMYGKKSFSMDSNASM